MIDVQLLKQADIVLSKCGRPIAPEGMSAVCFYRGIPIQAVFPVGPASASQAITREISGDTTFLLRAISSTSPAAMRIQIQLPNGRYLISNLADVLVFAGYGSWRWHLSEALECPPGTKITVTLVDANVAVAQSIALLFEGADRYLLKSRNGGRPQLASELPRYRRFENQNIMAPCWMAGVGPETPEGYEDQEFTYVSDLFTIAVGAADLTGTISIPIDQATDFYCRRLLFQQGVDQGVTGLILGRLRDSSGYALNDEYLDLVGLLNGVTMPGKMWRIEKGGEAFIDIQLVNGAGQGNVYFGVGLEGVRRRKL